MWDLNKNTIYMYTYVCMYIYKTVCMYLLSLYFYHSVTCLLKVVPNVQGVEIYPQIHTDTVNSRGTCIINNGGILSYRHFTFIHHYLEQVHCLESEEMKLSMLIPIKLFYEKTKKNSLKIKKPDHTTVKSMAPLSS